MDENKQFMTAVKFLEYLPVRFLPESGTVRLPVSESILS
jgi:hypothetical protein